MTQTPSLANAHTLLVAHHVQLPVKTGRQKVREVPRQGYISDPPLPHNHRVFLQLKDNATQHSREALVLMGLKSTAG